MTEPDSRQQVHYFVGSKHARIFQNPECSPDTVFDHIRSFIHQTLPGSSLSIDDLTDDFSFRNAEGILIGDLEQISQHIRAFPIESPHNKAAVSDAGYHFFDI